MKMKSYYGRWRTVGERTARVDGFDPRGHVWYGDIEGIGPTNWDTYGKHLINNEHDLHEPIPEKKEDKRTNE